MPDQESGSIDFVVNGLSNRGILATALNAPPLLRKLSDTEWNVVRQRTRAALHPEQAQMQQWFTKVLDELREDVAPTKRMLRECQMGEDDDGQSRSTREPLAATVDNDGLHLSHG